MCIIYNINKPNVEQWNINILNNVEVFMEYKYIQLNTVECENAFWLLTLSIRISNLLFIENRKIVHILIPKTWSLFVRVSYNTYIC